MEQTKTRQNNFCGIVLAGGKSRRMGVDKASLTLEGRTFLEIQADKLRTLGASDIIISGKTAALTGTRCVPDLYPDCGPLGGLYSCFLSSALPCALVLSVDVPLISLPTLKALLQLHMGGGYDATILSHDGNIEPLIAVYNTNIAGLAGELISNKKLAMKSFVDRLHYQLFSYEGSSEELLNCNSPEDHSALEFFAK